LILAFLVLTFALTWAAWFAAAGYAGLGPPFGMPGVLFLLGVFAPGIVAIALTARREGPAGVRALLAPIGQFRASVPIYLFALAYMPVAKLFGALVHRVMVGEWPAFGDTPFVLLLAALLLSTWVQAGEEIGWRGYALPRLADRFGRRIASLLVGVIWALWHLPLFLMPHTDTSGQSFPLYLLHVVALSVTLSWVYWRTGRSLFVVMLMHAAINNLGGIVSAAVPGADRAFALTGSYVGWGAAGYAWVIALVLLFQMRGTSHAEAEDRH
jgi:membrane protease YdiL (CAAX protease family)